MRTGQYRGINFRNCGPVLSEARLIQFEASLGYSLGDVYKEFLRNCNGGDPDRGYFYASIGGAAKQLWVDFFLFLDPSDGGLPAPVPMPSIEDCLDLYRQCWAEGSIPIGKVCRDHILTLFVSGPRVGEVHLLNWDLMPAEAELDGPTAEHFEMGRLFVARSFDDFIDMLSPS